MSLAAPKQLVTIVPVYRIRVQGHLGPAFTRWFDGLAIANLVHGEAELVGMLADQAALHGVLLKIRDLGLPSRASGACSGPIREYERG